MNVQMWNSLRLLCLEGGLLGNERSTVTIMNPTSRCATGCPSRYDDGYRAWTFSSYGMIHRGTDTPRRYCLHSHRLRLLSPSQTTIAVATHLQPRPLSQTAILSQISRVKADITKQYLVLQPGISRK